MSLPTLMQQYIHLSRYARWLPEEGRRETWEETVKRYFDFFEGHIERNTTGKLTPAVRKELETAVLNLDIMPSMRCLMTAGPALERENIAGYNCFSRGTEFITDQGIKSFNDFNDGDKVNILGEKSFKPATIKKFGKEKLYELVFTKGGKTKKSVFVTGNHRWITIKKNGPSGKIRNVKTTLELNSGDVIKYFPKGVRNSELQPCSIGIQHGMVFGDGTLDKNKGFCKITLCGDSTQFSNLFTTGHPTTINPVNGNITHVQLPWNWKEIPDIQANRSYLMGFLMGWFGADGTIGRIGSSGSNISISNANYDNLVSFRGIAAKLGIFTSDIVTRRINNPFDLNEEDKPLYEIAIYRDTLPKYFFLKDSHQSRFNSIKIMSKYDWTVSHINEIEKIEDVWCIQEPENEIFTLSNGIQTMNCTYIAIDSIRAFDEVLYILMNGAGVGFSVEEQYVNKLPIIESEFHMTDTVVVVPDSKLGWAKGLRELIAMLYSGQIPKWDLSRVRPAGAPLKTFGGRASGPEPLNSLFEFCSTTFANARGRRLTSIECHDIVCKIAEIVVVGGVRRSALISLSDLTDERMRHAKTGQWWQIYGQRALANNSAVYNEKPEIGVFMAEWLSLYDSKSGERGIFSRQACKKQVEKNERRDSDYDFGTNPCSEIILRNRQMCNLSEVIIKDTDSVPDLEQKVRLATILGTLQSTLTNFKYVTSPWKANCEEERLLGVSLTGIMDNVLTNGRFGNLPEFLTMLKSAAVETNAQWAKKLGINPSTAITCVKPSGTVSLLVNSASGIHPRHSPFYIRTVRADKKDPLSKMMVEQGFPVEDDITQPMNTHVFSFPTKSPDLAIFKDYVSAIDQLETWMTYQRYWCEHKPSCTISVKEHEWLEVGAWVYKNFDEMCGVSFLPAVGHIYKQAPLQECTEEQYNSLLAKMPTNVNWENLNSYENTDQTIGSQELACSSSGGCEI